MGPGQQWSPRTAAPAPWRSAAKCGKAAPAEAALQLPISPDSIEVGWTDPIKIYPVGITHNNGLPASSAKPREGCLTQLS
jgi:hypothetical protein